MARLVLPVVGAIIGSYFGAPQVGWAIGSLIAGVAFQETIKNRQPRLDDLKVTRGSYGSVFPYVDGAMRVGAWVAWASDRRAIDTTTTEDSKGGPKVETTTTTYEVDMLIILASNRIAGVRRIWQDGELVWSRADDSDFATVIGSNTFARRVTVYTGADDQLPDPTYEAAVGVGNAPAYRERGSIFLEGWDLGQSGQIRNLTFEVYTAGSEATIIETLSGMPSQVSGDSVGFPAFDSDGYTLSRWNNNSKLIHTYNVSGIDGIEFETTRLPDLPYNERLADRGTTDVSGVLVGSPIFETSLDDGVFYGDDGSTTQFTWPSAISGTENVRFARAGNWMVVGSLQSPAVERLYLYNATTGGLIGSSDAFADTIWGYMTIIGNTLYATVGLAAPGGIDVFSLSGAGIAYVDNFDTPSNGSAESRIFADEADRLYLKQGSTLYRWNGTDWDTLITGLSSLTGTAGPNEVRYGYSKGVLWVAYNEGGSPIQVKAIWRAVTLAPVSLQDVVERLHDRAGMDSSLVDASALASKTTYGFALGQATTTRAAVELLASAYFFEAVKDDGIRYVNRGGAAVATIPYEDLGSTEAGADGGEPLQMVDANDIELPAYLSVRYANVLDDYQDGSEMSDRLITDSIETRVVEVSLAMTPTEAKQLAQKLALDLQASKVRVGPIVLQRKYAALQPTDPILIEGRQDITVRMRVTKRDEAAGLITLEGVVDDATVPTGTSVTDSSYSGSFTITLPSRTDWRELDIPLLRDQDDYNSFEVAFGAHGSNWRGAVYFGGDDDTSLAQLTSVTTETVVGTCTTALGAWGGGNLLDISSTVEVQTDGELSSVTYEQLMGGANYAAITSAGRTEILQFQNAELISAGNYRLSNFLRYRKGTEGVTHAVADKFVLLQTSGIRVIAADLQRINQERRYKAVSVGRQPSSVSSRAFAWTGEKLKPLSPTSVRGSRSSGDLTITWDRRTRYAENWLTGLVPLGEVAESYEVDIMNGSTVMRTLTSSSASVTYSSADQTTDFGGPQASVSVRVYQISDVIGRGNVATATV